VFELCHVVWFVAPGAPERAGLQALGLAPSFKRAHPGQGTRNVCFCFDNAYLELVWIEDAVAARSMAGRLRLVERADPSAPDVLPFGFGIRTDRALPFAAFAYRPPFLPAGTAIAVAVESEDGRQPLIFRSPGSLRPDAWTDGHAGARQAAAGLEAIIALRLDLPAPTPTGRALGALVDAGLLTLGRAAGAPRLRLSIARADGGVGDLLLPDAAWADPN
jgi:hypothetical protein